MEHRPDYLLSQIDMVSKLLRRLLEKLLKIKSGDDNEEEELQSIMLSQISADKEALMVDALQSIDDAQLVATLVSTYGYSADSLKLLADVLYQLSNKVTANGVFRRKALILYRHYLAGSKTSIDFLAFSRLSEIEQDEAASLGSVAAQN